VIKVSIYEDNASLLETLSYLIREAGSFELCTASPNAVNIIEDCHRLCPDIILMDTDMPELSGIEATRIVKNAFPEVNVMIYLVFENRDILFDALCVGATGFIMKKTSAIELIKSIEELYQGGSSIYSGVAIKTLEYFNRRQRHKKQAICPLTPLEQDILQHFQMGDSCKMVADACYISIGTVHSHINNIYKKLHLYSKSEALMHDSQFRVY